MVSWTIKLPNSTVAKSCIDEVASRSEAPTSSMQEIQHEPEFLGRWNGKQGAGDYEDERSLSSTSSKSKSLKLQARRASQGLGMNTGFRQVQSSWSSTSQLVLIGGSAKVSSL